MESGNKFSAFNVGQSRTGSSALDVVLIIDRSGSMAGTESAMKRGYNKMLEYLSQMGKNITISTILFDDCDKIDIVCNGQKVNEIKNEIPYEVGGSTAKYDAIGVAIEYENERKKDPKNPFPNADVLYLTVSDGDENASVKYDESKIHKAMDDERARGLDGKGKREFGFINEFGIYSNKIQSSMSVDDNHLQIFLRGERGINALFQTVDIAVENMFLDGRITSTWKEKSNLLPIGDVTLGEVKTIVGPMITNFEQNEQALAELIKIAGKGMTRNFVTQYSEFVKRMQLATIESKTKHDDLDDIIKMYVASQKDPISALKEAVAITSARCRNGCILAIEKIKEMAQNKEAIASRFYEAVEQFSLNKKALKSIPATAATIAGKPESVMDYEIKINSWMHKPDEDFINTIAIVYGLRKKWVLESFNKRLVFAVDRYAEFAVDPQGLLSGKLDFEQFRTIVRELKSQSRQMYPNGTRIL
jgi:hypothetical protein